MSSIGKMFKVSIFGESHGQCVGALIEGCPPGIKINEREIQKELERRRPGKGILVSSRDEREEFKIISGIFNGYTTGAPIAIIIWNRDVDSSYYEEIKDLPRPGHADYVAKIKYSGFNDYRGGGIFSGRITAAFVVAGVIAKKVLEKFGIKIVSHIVQIGDIKAKEDISIEEVENNSKKLPIECGDIKAAEKMIRLIKKIKSEGDSIGGVVEVIAINLPIGLGEPIFDTLEGDISKAVFAIPGVKGIEFGAGFNLARMRGSEANDQYVIRNGKVTMLSNNSGGIHGGISNGMPIKFRVVFKPTPSILKPQKTVDLNKMEERILRLKGRFDPCITIRTPPILEAVLAITLADHLLRWLCWKSYMTS